MSLPLLRYPVIVEGRYDTHKLRSIARGEVIQLDGFAIYRDRDKQALLRRLAACTPVIVLTDPDGAGAQLRAFLSGLLPPDRTIMLYAPPIVGKERRKSAPSRAGVLGVEGVPAEALRVILSPYFADEREGSSLPPPLTTGQMISLGLSGCPGAEKRREALCRKAKLPRMTAPALRRALPLLFSYEELERMVADLDEGDL